MSKLNVQENKKLKLKNVMVQELTGIAMEELDKEINTFINKVQTLNVQTFGPLITCNKGLKIGEDGSMTVDYEVMIQAHDYLQYKNSFKVLDEVVVEHCVYLRFEDQPEYINFAYSKMDLYFYENDIDELGPVYTIMLHESENLIKMDLFKPVKLL